MSTHRNGIEAAIRKAGSIQQLAELLGLSYQAIQQWRHRIPAERLMDIEKVTDVPRHKLRPDLFKGYVREPA